MRLFKKSKPESRAPEPKKKISLYGPTRKPEAPGEAQKTKARRATDPPRRPPPSRPPNLPLTKQQRTIVQHSITSPTKRPLGAGPMVPHQHQQQRHQRADLVHHAASQIRSMSHPSQKITGSPSHQQTQYNETDRWCRPRPPPSRPQPPLPAQAPTPALPTRPSVQTAATVTDSDSSQQPQTLQNSAESRVRVVLGGRGSDFLLLLEEDDGHKQWQSQFWKNLPRGLEDHLRKVDVVHQCSFAANNDWFLNGRETVTQQTKSWWSVSSADFHQALQAAVKSGLQVRVVFGDPSLNQYIILLGPNGFALGKNLPLQLLESMDNVYNAGSAIARIRGLNGNGRFLLEETIIGDDEEKEEEVSIKNSNNISDNANDGAEKCIRTCYHDNGLSPHLKDEIVASLKNGSSDVLDIGIGTMDGSWVLIRDGKYETSVGIHVELVGLLESFYQRHRTRQEAQKRKTAHLIEQQRLIGQQDKPLKNTLHSQMQAAREEEVNERCALQRERLQEIWLKARKRRVKEDCVTEIRNKGLKKGDNVTVLGTSLAPGDSTIVEINEQNAYIVVARESGKEEGCMIQAIIDDPIQIIKHTKATGGNDEGNELFQLARAEDKFEAAVLMYHSHIKSKTCPCKNDFSGYSQRIVHPNPWQPGDEVHVIGYGDAAVIEPDEKCARNNPYLVHVEYSDGTTYHVPASQVRAAKHCVSPEYCEFQVDARQCDETALRIRPLFEKMEPYPDVSRFDEYKCPERIDLRRLQRLADNLRLDCAERRHCMNAIVEHLDGSSDEEELYECEEFYRTLDRCYDFEETVFTMYDFLKGQPVDENGCLVHEVQYRHKDVSCRGRLFALGRSVRVLEEKFPRTLTLQAVQAELRKPLAGAFAHEIDCENSDIRIVCSLAKQLGLEATTASIRDFRDNRCYWLDAIQREHPTIPEKEIKRLPNIILSGGSYEAWVNEMDSEYAATEVSRFGFRLFAEVRAFREQLLRNPRFRWIEFERAMLRNRSIIGEDSNAILFMRILQACENEVLSIVQRTFHECGCIVRSKLFDTILVERGPQTVDAKATIQDVIERTENMCATHGWDVHLVEKPLFGMEDDAIPCVEEARAVSDIWLGRGYAGIEANQEELSSSEDDYQDVMNEDIVSDHEADSGSYAAGHLEKQTFEELDHLESKEQHVDLSTNDKERGKHDGSLCFAVEEISSSTMGGSSVNEYSEVTATESSE